MNTYLKSFYFPTLDEEENFIYDMPDFNMSCYNNIYPFKVLPEYIRELNFAPITILYGTNGSGKTTMLNLMAERLGINRSVRFNKGHFTEYFVNLCDYELAQAPMAMKMITSDDVFSSLFLTREKNEIIDDNREKMFKFRVESFGGGNEGLRERMEELIGDGNWIENFDVLQDVVDARNNKKMSGSKFVRKKVGGNIIGKSNGETAIDFFNNSITEPGIYLLDEPENSLSAAVQRELAEFIFESARFFGAQFVISTHSPFMLSIPTAKIYNLDDGTSPVTDDWTSLDNMIEYYNLFSSFADDFEG